MKTTSIRRTWGHKILWCAAFTLTMAATGHPQARAQDFEAAPNSKLASMSLAQNALRVKAADVPAEITDALKTLVKGAGDGVKQGRNEVLAWSGNGYKKSKVPQIKAQVAKSLKAAGWEYEEGVPDAETGPFTLATALKTSPTRKALIGMWMPSDDALLLAWTETLPAGASTKPESAKPQTSAPKAVTATKEYSKPVAAPVADADAGATTFSITVTKNYVNLMKTAMPTLPTFPQLAVKPGFVRGYVKDMKGRPLQGAVIGARSTSAGGFYSGASAKTDAKGYYEIQVPWGAASYYCAGYTIDWGEGRAALGLHPADGEASSFATAKGSVENWVLLHYGIADRDEVSHQPHYSGNYYGGAFTVSYSVGDSRPVFADSYSLPDGSEIEITLTPDGKLLDGSAGRVFVLRRPVTSDTAGLFYVNNIPVGQYRIAARLIHNGSSVPLLIKETGPYANQSFGLEPKEGRGEVSISFRPDGAKAEMATAQRGNWDSLNITLYR